MHTDTDAYASRLAVAWRLRRRADRMVATLEAVEAGRLTLVVYRNQRELLTLDATSNSAMEMSRGFHHLLVATGWRDEDSGA